MRRLDRRCRRPPENVMKRGERLRLIRMAQRMMADIGRDFPRRKRKTWTGWAEGKHRLPVRLR